MTPAANGAPLLNVKIIAETGGFLYVSPGLKKSPFEVVVLAIPESRVRAIQYNVGATIIGR